MRNINIVTRDVQDFKTLIEILSGFVTEVNAEVIKDKNAYVKKRQNVKDANMTDYDSEDNSEDAYNSKDDYASDDESDDESENDTDNESTSEDNKNSKKLQSSKVPAKSATNKSTTKQVSKSSSKSSSKEGVKNSKTGKNDKAEVNKTVRNTKLAKNNNNDSKSVKSTKSTKSIESDKSTRSTKSTKSTKSVKSAKSSKITKGSKKSNKDDTEDSESDKEENNESEEHDSRSEESDDIEEDEVENPGQIKILTPNDDQVMLVFLTLDGKHFDKFEVLGKNNDASTSYTIGLDLEELNKFMKGVPKEGSLTIYQDTSMMEFICFDVSDESKGTANICDLRRINIEKPPDKNIEVNVSMVVRMPCALFHKACKDLHQFDPFVEFICDRDTFKIVCMGEQSNQERRFTDNSRKKNKDNNTDQNYDIKITLSKDIEKETRKAQRKAELGSDADDLSEEFSDEEDEDRSDESEESEEPEVIRLLFDLRYINYMYKCQNIADYVYIHLTPRGIMFLSYEINMLGNLLVGIAPKNRDTDQDYNEDNDRYYEDDKPIKIKRDLN